MQYSLSHHHGTGNDFLVFDLAQGVPNGEWPDLARLWCDRDNGVGADGLLILGRESSTDLTMILFNADGSRAEMSGNGIRCLVQAAHQSNGSRSGANYIVSTDAGERSVTVLEVSDNDTSHISADMGTVEPIQEPTQWHLWNVIPTVLLAMCRSAIPTRWWV